MGDSEVAAFKEMLHKKALSLSQLNADDGSPPPLDPIEDPPPSPGSQSLVTNTLQACQLLVDQQAQKEEEKLREIADGEARIEVLRQKVAQEEAELARFRDERREDRVQAEKSEQDFEDAQRKRTVSFKSVSKDKDNDNAEDTAVAASKAERPYVPPVSFWAMFRLATLSDKIYWVAGVVGAALAGLMMPVFLWFFKDVLSDGFKVDGNAAERVFNISLQFLIIGAIQGFFGGIEVACLKISAERQGMRFKKTYLRAILRQDQAWFDTTQVEQINSSMERDTLNVEEALGHKTGQFVRQGATVCGGLVIAFSQGWQMALLCLATTPLMALVATWLTKSLAGFASRGEGAYASAGGVAEQAISSIRTVMSLGGHQREVDRYSTRLGDALAVGLKKVRNNGLGLGAMQGIMMGSYALAMWFGGWLVTNEVPNGSTGAPFNGGDVMMIFWAVMFGGFAIGQIGPALEAFGLGRASAARMFQVMDRVPPIDTLSDHGTKLEPAGVEGRIEFVGVNFTYPARKEAKIFQNLNLTIPAGQTVALVGASGSGKSSVVSLIERFYDPDAGTVFLDGQDLRSLNVKSLRRNIGLVGQEPILFATTIAENIRYGKPDATQAEIEAAARSANAHNFIMELPAAYETQVGARGTQLSGGQKQRVAIARAVISNPKIILLDEATSALDAESEHVVQEALDKLMEGRTTVVVAHRLSTIRGADKIVVFDKHRKAVLEEGTHDQLVNRDGGYAKLMKAQLAGSLTTTIAKRLSVSRRLSSSDMKRPNAPEEPIEIKIGLAEAPAAEGSKQKPESHFRRALRMNKPERGWLVAGLLSALLNGGTFPLMAYLLTKVLANFFACQATPTTPPVYVTFYKTMVDCVDEHSSGCYEAFGFVGYPYASKQACYDAMTDKQNLFCIGFAILGLVGFVANFFQVYSFGTMGENLTRRLREAAFGAALRQEIGWFDLKENSVGAVTSLLSVETSRVEGAVGTSLGLMTQNLCLSAVSLFIAFSQGWALTLICLGVMPILMIAMKLQMSYLMTADGAKKYAEAASISVEATSGARTIAAFSAEDRVEQLYENALQNHQKGMIKKAGVAGFGAGFSLTAMFLFNFAGFAGGAWLMSMGTYTFENVMQVFMSIQFMGMGAGQAASLAPDVAKSKPAMEKVFGLIDRKSLIDPTNPTGEKVDAVVGDLEFRGVEFRYPARPDVPIFDGLNLSIKSGTTVALVGGSGSGKSTVVGLIERFYDPLLGSVLLDNKDLRTLNVKSLRSHIGFVGQEPTLFATTIAENIRYAKPNATATEIEEAARSANAHDFIMALPERYQTQVGSRGTQLSGGQKQRVAIARAILSNPRILLLDEATSALDTESERVVQEALDKLMKHRTTVVVAHRLSTIRNADKIVVFAHGVMVEEGTHVELSANPNSAYSLLVKTQMGIV